MFRDGRQLFEYLHEHHGVSNVPFHSHAVHGTIHKIFTYVNKYSYSMIECQISVTFHFCLQIKPEMLDTLYKYAKFQYECGNYSGAAEYLYFYRVLVSRSSQPALLTPVSAPFVLCCTDNVSHIFVNIPCSLQEMTKMH